MRVQREVSGEPPGAHLWSCQVAAWLLSSQPMTTSLLFTATA